MVGKPNIRLSAVLQVLFKLSQFFMAVSFVFTIHSVVDAAALVVSGKNEHGDY